MNKHPARKLQYDSLYALLQEQVSLGHIKQQADPLRGIALYCYTDQTVYERLWNPITMMTRGLILDTVNKQVVATPFPKFFNYEEVESLPEHVSKDILINEFITHPFEAFEKMDGSLIIIYHHNDEWHCATKGSLSSEQAKWAQQLLDQQDIAPLVTGVTYLAEAIYPENRIVVNYGSERKLVLLGAYDAYGLEYSHSRILELAIKLGWEAAPHHAYNTVEEALTKAKELSCNEEGWVLRSISGQRLKIKGAEYCRVHRLISNLTPLAIWRSLKDREDLELFRKSLPEEFWTDFDNIKGILWDSLYSLLVEIDLLDNKITKLSNKEIGLQLQDYPQHLQQFIFSCRKYGGPGGLLENARTRIALFEKIRPNGNLLPGYVPSATVVRAQNAEE